MSAQWLSALKEQSREEFFKETVLPRVSEGAIEEALKSYIGDKVLYADTGDLYDRFRVEYGLDWWDDDDMVGIVESHVKEVARQMLQKL